MEKQTDQRLTPECEHDPGRNGQHEREPELDAKDIPHAVAVALAEKLCAENARAGHAAEHAEIEYEHELIRDRHARHLLCADLSDHDVIEQTDKVRDAVLDHDRNGKRKNHGIECFIADKFLFEVHSYSPS